MIYRRAIKSLRVPQGTFVTSNLLNHFDCNNNPYMNNNMCNYVYHSLSLILTLNLCIDTAGIIESNNLAPLRVYGLLYSNANLIICHMCLLSIAIIFVCINY